MLDDEEARPVHPDPEPSSDQAEALHLDEKEDADNPAAARKEKNGVIEALVLVLIALVLALTLKTYVAEAYEIKGKSMQTTFESGQRVVVLKAFYSIGHGDIVVFSSSEDPAKDLIKRVIALPGETIKVAGGNVEINGRKLSEAYARHDERELRDSPIEMTIRDDEYFVLGDNRPDSHDSRSFGPIPRSSIKGKVVVRWWPPETISSY
jgi:signal peptidase I